MLTNPPTANTPPETSPLVKINVSWKEFLELDPITRAKAANDIFEYWLPILATAKQHWSIFLPQYTSTLTPFHLDYDLLTTVTIQWSELLAHFDGHKPINIYMIDCVVEEVSGILTVLKEGMEELGEPVKEDRFAAILEQVLLRSLDGRLLKQHRRSLMWFEGIMDVVLDQIGRPTPALHNVPQPQPQKKCFKCGAATTKTGTPLLKCNACKTARYCSSDCQKLDWRQHRPICKQVQGKGVGNDEATPADRAKA